MARKSRIVPGVALLVLLSTTVLAQDNVLLIILDDVGVDRVAAYGESPTAGPTPTMDLLAEFGVLFRNAYANPVCSPTRATILTGRYSFRTGIGGTTKWIGNGPDEFELSSDEVTLAEVLDPTHQTVAVGKWHLGTAFGSGYQHPIESGFELFAGTRENLGGLLTPPSVYFSWEKTIANEVGNQQYTSESYATTDNVDDAAALIRRYDSDPWFLWLGLNAAHTPYHVPPDDLTSIHVNDFSAASVKHRAMVEAMDTEIRRLLLSIDRDVLARTWVIVVGDNGTQGSAVSDPSLVNKSKGTVYEGGVNVPLIIVGPGLRKPGREVDALVNTTDLYTTILDMTGTAKPPRKLDSVSLMPYLRDADQAPIRRFAYVELFDPNGLGEPSVSQRAVRNDRYKLMRTKVGKKVSDALYDLQADPHETDDLMSKVAFLSPEERAAHREFMVLLDTLEPGSETGRPDGTLPDDADPARPERTSSPGAPGVPHSSN